MCSNLALNLSMCNSKLDLSRSVHWDLFQGKGLPNLSMITSVLINMYINLFSSMYPKICIESVQNFLFIINKIMGTQIIIKGKHYPSYWTKCIYFLKLGTFV